MKIFKKSLILLCCLSGFSATGLPSQSSGGVFMKEIKLSKCTSKYSNSNSPKKEYSVMVDDEDFEHYNRFAWQYNEKASKTNCVYAQRHGAVNGKKTTIRMHREIMGVTDPKIHVDHIDTNPLNNQRANLRLCSHTQNCQNSSHRKNSASKYKGVSKTKNRWCSKIHPNNQRITLGYFDTEEEAALAYDVAAKIYYGEFANLNFKK